MSDQNEEEKAEEKQQPRPQPPQTLLPSRQRVADSRTSPLQAQREGAVWSPAASHPGMIPMRNTPAPMPNDPSRSFVHYGRAPPGVRPQQPLMPQHFYPPPVHGMPHAFHPGMPNMRPPPYPGVWMQGSPGPNMAPGGNSASLTPSQGIPHSGWMQASPNVGRFAGPPVHACTPPQSPQSVSSRLMRGGSPDNRQGPGQGEDMQKAPEGNSAGLMANSRSSIQSQEPVTGHTDTTASEAPATEEVAREISKPIVSTTTTSLVAPEDTKTVRELIHSLMAHRALRKAESDEDKANTESQPIGNHNERRRDFHAVRTEFLASKYPHLFPQAQERSSSAATQSPRSSPPAKAKPVPPVPQAPTFDSPLKIGGDTNSSDPNTPMTRRPPAAHQLRSSGHAKTGPRPPPPSGPWIKPALNRGSMPRVVAPYGSKSVSFITPEHVCQAIPENASCIFHILDRRINFDAHSEDTSFYALLRSFVQDDPYRQIPPPGSNGLDLLSLPSDRRTALIASTATEPPKKKRRKSPPLAKVDLISNLSDTNRKLPVLWQLQDNLVARGRWEMRRMRKERAKTNEACRERLRCIGIILPALDKK